MTIWQRIKFFLQFGTLLVIKEINIKKIKYYGKFSKRLGGSVECRARNKENQERVYGRGQYQLQQRDYYYNSKVL